MKKTKCKHDDVNGKRILKLEKTLDKKSAAKARIEAAEVRITEACSSLNSAMQALSSVVETRGCVLRAYSKLREIERDLRRDVQHELEEALEGDIALDREPVVHEERPWLFLSIFAGEV